MVSIAILAIVETFQGAFLVLTGGFSCPYREPRTNLPNLSVHSVQSIQSVQKVQSIQSVQSVQCVTTLHLYVRHLQSDL